MTRPAAVAAPEAPSPAVAGAGAERWALALRVIALLAANPAGIGGVVVRARPGPVRDAWVQRLAEVARVQRLPASADAEALDGGLDLAATLAAGRPVARRGLLAVAAGGVVLVPMAERLAPALAARLARALDDNGPLVVAFDEAQRGEDTADRVTAALEDRLAIHLDLEPVWLPMAQLLAGQLPVAPAPPAVDPTPVDDAVTALATAAVQLGIASVRAPLQAQRVARALAQLDGRSAVASGDVEIAAALVLGPRARQLPQSQPSEAPEPPDAPPEPPPADTAERDSAAEPPGPQDLTDMVLDAAATALPPGLLDALANGVAFKAPAGGSSGAKLRTLTSGRPAGVRAGAPGRGARLALIDTIKAAAPWQRLRGPRAEGRLAIRHTDLRIRRFVARAQSTTIFAVDASGSAAIARLAEAKGAVELLLAAAYVKRAEVALVAFRGQEATLTLPPTRSLARAKKELAALAGGGGTPMAAGIDLAHRVAVAERARGRTPLVVVLTDGRANVGGDTARSPQDAALASARGLGLSGIASVFIDCSARARPEGAALAAAMGARFVALPRLDARAVVAAVNAVAGA
jgi:magnesium chelatase subunit D